MTGMPCALALVTTWAPAPLRSTSSMTSQPLVNCCSASVAYLPVSFRAFWMSVVMPMASKPAFSAGRSPFSQRLDESASGNMTQAFLPATPAPPEPAAEDPAAEVAAGVVVVLESLLLPHPAARRVTAAVAASTPASLDLMRIHYSFVTGSKQFRTLCRLRAWSPKPAASRCDTPETFSTRRATFFAHDRDRRCAPRPAADPGHGRADSRGVHRDRLQGGQRPARCRAGDPPAGGRGDRPTRLRVDHGAARDPRRPGRGRGVRQSGE